jgi:hypothetical protein
MGSRISIDFDIFRYVLIFLTYFGHSSSVRVGYRHDAKQETEGMDYLEFIAKVPSHIPDKNRVMVRYDGL